MKMVKQRVAVHEVNRPSLCSSYFDCKQELHAKDICGFRGNLSVHVDMVRASSISKGPLFSATQVGIFSYFIGAGIRGYLYLDCRLEMSSSESFYFCTYHRLWMPFSSQTIHIMTKLAPKHCDAYKMVSYCEFHAHAPSGI